MSQHKHLWVEYKWLDRCLTCLVLKKRDAKEPEKCQEPGCVSDAMFLNALNNAFWCKTHNPSLKTSKEVKTRFGVLLTVPAGMDWCVECGHIDEPEEFARMGQCVNPDCTRPEKWE